MHPTKETALCETIIQGKEKKKRWWRRGGRKKRRERRRKRWRRRRRRSSRSYGFGDTFGMYCSVKIAKCLRMDSVSLVLKRRLRMCIVCVFISIKKKELTKLAKMDT